MSKHSSVATSVLPFVGMLVGGLYTTFVLTTLWNWFVIPTFHTAEMPFWVMFGLLLLVRLFKANYYEGAQDQTRWEKLLLMVQASVPAEKMDDVKAELFAF